MTVSRVSMHPEGPEVSRLIFGVWRLADNPQETSVADVRAKIDTCLSLGITTFDHADIYGGYVCEELFGRALEEDTSLRDKMEIITKCDICLTVDARPSYYVKHYDTSASHITQSVENSLRNLRTEQLDVLLLHRPDPLMDADEVASTLQGLIEQGKLKHVGVSNFTPSQVSLLASRLDVPLVTNQIECSVLHLDPLHDGTLDQCQERRMRPMIWSPLGGGRLFTGDGPREVRVREAMQLVANEHQATLTQIAYAWLLRHPSHGLPILGTNQIERIKETAGCEAITLDRQQWFRIWEASAGHEVP